MSKKDNGIYIDGIYQRENYTDSPKLFLFCSMILGSLLAIEGICFVILTPMVYLGIVCIFMALGIAGYGFLEPLLESTDVESNPEDN